MDIPFKLIVSVPFCSSSTMWATWLEEKCSHYRTSRMVFWEGTEKVSHSFLDPSPKQTHDYKYSDILSNHSRTLRWLHSFIWNSSCNVKCNLTCCPLGGPSRCWASHSLCLELWRKGLPTNKNVHSTGKQKYTFIHLVGFVFYLLCLLVLFVSVLLSHFHCASAV